MNLIEVKNLGKTYYSEGVATEALIDISFSIQKGEFVAVMGPSGSGKSTLLHILGFLDEPTKGEYYFQEKIFKNYTQNETAEIRNKNIGFVFQMFNLLPRATVFENIALPLIYSKEKQNLWKEKVINAVEQVGLAHRINHESSKLSGGEKQRVAIARALVNSPYVIFADEPTGNLDSKSGGQIMNIIKDLNDKGHTIILITHETYTAEYAERIITLKDGLIYSDQKVENRRTHKDHFIK